MLSNHRSNTNFTFTWRLVIYNFCRGSSAKFCSSCLFHHHSAPWTFCRISLFTSIPTGQRKFWEKKSMLTWRYVLAAIYLHLGLLYATLRWILCANRDQQGHRGLPRSTKDSQIHILCGRRYQDNKCAWNAAQTSQKLENKATCKRNQEWVSN